MISSSVPRPRHPLGKVLGPTLITAIVAMATAVHASVVLGPKEYVARPGEPMVAIERFPACQPERGGLLRVENGPRGRRPVGRAVLVLNRRETVVVLEGQGHHRVIERAVQLASSNTLLVWMTGPPGATLAVSITSPGGCLDVAITSPAPDASVPAGTLLVRGTVEGPPGVGVAVNGVPAAVHGEEFVVQLAAIPGVTELAATATAPDGSTAEARRSVTVVEAPEAPVRLLANPPGGLSPLSVGFSLSSLVGLSDVKLDLQGDGSVEFEGPSVDGQMFDYAQPGVYVATVRATDIDGQVHSASAVVEVYDRAALDGRLQTIWDGFRDAVRAGNLSAVASLLHSETRGAYADQLSLLRPQTLARIDAYLTAIGLVEVGAKGAEYEMRRVRDEVALSFAVWFRVDQDGTWRLFGF
jgi:hypothetical protein